MSDDEHENIIDVLALARAYIQSHNYGRAVEVLVDVLARQPREVVLIVELAEAHRLAGDVDAAKRTIDYAQTLAPEDTRALSVRAAIFADLGEWRAAERWARRAVKRMPFDVEARYQLGRILVGAEKPIAALEVLNELVTMEPENADIHVLKGAALALLGRREDSIAEFGTALRLDPGNAYAVHGLAVHKVVDRKFTKALSGLRDAAGLNPAIGDAIRTEIAAIIRTWLNWVTLGAWAAIYIATHAGHGSEVSPVPRIIAAIGSVILFGVCVWVARSLPLVSWRSLFGRGKEFTTLKCYAGLSVLVTFALAAYALGLAGRGLLAIVLLLTVAGTWILPAMDREREENPDGRDRDQDPYREWNREKY